MSYVSQSVPRVAEHVPSQHSGSGAASDPPQALDWQRDAFMTDILTLSHDEGDARAAAEIQRRFPQVQDVDVRLWLVYIKECYSSRISPRPFLMDTFRSVSWFDAIVFRGERAREDAPELVFRPAESPSRPGLSSRPLPDPASSHLTETAQENTEVLARPPSVVNGDAMPFVRTRGVANILLAQIKIHSVNIDQIM
ncbi:hypothetical protein AURDEDRAFT_176739 [Auricularia subglabra TFB-10046 SS5]|uniref:Uncharacterized protein n=1 Tax=Auricularia subglabra (strain TFB-10046 / SS5) TaxID=717982 RepID=J0WP71_AURST|nr:hypothetical protein AURDEDRAFT_176739 [Auricularia subglabra TFB-10046 SS5]